MKLLSLLLIIFNLQCASSLTKLERMSRPIIVVAKTNIEEDRSIIVKDSKNRLLKITETAFVYSYNPGDTLK